MNRVAGAALRPKGNWNLLSLAHFVNDLYANFTETFAPLLIQQLGISMGQAGFLSTVGGLMHSVVQPVTGYLSDRLGHSSFIRYGVIGSGLFGSLIPLAPNYPLAVLCVMLWGMSTASFHPQAQGAVGYLAGDQKNSIPLGLAIFTLGGTLGSAFGPLYGIGLYNGLPHGLMPVAGTLLPLLTFGLCTFYMPRIHERSADRGLGLGELPGRFWRVLKLIWPVWMLTISRDFAKRAMTFLFPLIIAAKGGSLALGGFMLFCSAFLAAMAPLWVARYHPNWTASKTALVTLPTSMVLLALGTVAPLALSNGCLLVGVGLLSAGQSLNDALAQSRAVHDRSTVSSLTMGLSYGLAGLVLTPVGMLAQSLGINRVVCMVALLPLIGLWAVLFIWPKHGLR